MLVGIPLWDSLNLVMVAIATGGFTVHSGGLAYYNNPLLRDPAHTGDACRCDPVQGLLSSCIMAKSVRCSVTRP